MTIESTPARTSKALHIGLWVVQILLGVTFVGTALWKALTPIPKLASMIPWAGQVSPAFLYFTALVDFLGGLGLVLPAATRIKPVLTPVAALGCAALQLAAIVFHTSRGEVANTPFNYLLVALSVFVFWGRQFRAPIAPRQ
ncbi:MAG: DoxX family protein [Deltaproteobacteria bacterium]|nr:DoxX family protein [Deltaproteobacteria bacterium]